MRSLLDISLEVSAEGLLEALKLPHRVMGSQSAAGVRLVGWNRERDDMSIVEVKGLRDFVEGLPSIVANRLLDKVLRLSAKRLGLSKEDDPAVSILSLAGVFLHPNATSLSLSSLSAPALLLSKIPNCTALTNLDLSGHTSLADGPLAKILAELPVLQTLNLRGCIKAGNQSVMAISKAAESRLLNINLSLTAVTIKGLASLLARCSRLEVLKIANVGGLVSLPYWIRRAVLMRRREELKSDYTTGRRCDCRSARMAPHPPLQSTYAQATIDRHQRLVPRPPPRPLCPLYPTPRYLLHPSQVPRHRIPSSPHGTLLETRETRGLGSPPR